jgi:nucleoid-associated protein YgaU
MNKFIGLGGGPALGAGVAVVALAVAVVGYVVWSTAEEEARPESPSAGISGTAEGTDAPPQADAATELPQTAATESAQTLPDTALPEADVPEPETAEDTAPQPPRIDTFRLDHDGRFLLAGHTAPDWNTFVLIDGETLGEVTPDAEGSFVSFMTLDSDDTPRVLSLLMRQEGEADIFSTDEILVAPFAQPVAEAEPPREAPASDIAVSDPSAEEPGAPALLSDEQAALESMPEAKDPPQPRPQAVLRSGEDGVELIQPAPAAVGLAQSSPEAMTAVALDAISYTETGEVELAGRGQGQGFVRVYVDNAPIATSRIEADGRWRTDLPEVDAGVYTLRVDEIDAGGAVLSRVETPFQREAAELVTDRQETHQPEEAPLAQTRISAVTVQPGSTLWAISRERYGEGILYMRVFEANRDHIRDPDLIYPGQVFTLPE